MLSELNGRIDEAAREAGREPEEIRRGYNLMGTLYTGCSDTRAPGLKAEFISGTVGEWVDLLVHWYQDYGQDTFIFWPIAGNQLLQNEAALEPNPQAALSRTWRTSALLTVSEASPSFIARTSAKSSMTSANRS
jgi:alkanesulfonate monooxygenase SsuD/methylene tetrahydromethanopterin reductase-like flavin-dependent oxidoreductase (luciferase family)